MHPMMVPFLQFVFSVGMIFVASRWLTRASDAIARITRLGHFLVGGLFLAASTSAPEFFVDLHATVRGLPNLATGDLLGSSLVNLFILSLCILIFNRRVPTTLQNITWPAVTGILLTVVVAIAILVPGPEFWGIGLASYVIALIYVLGLRFLFKSDVPIVVDEAQQSPVSRYLLFKSVGLFLVASLLLLFMAPILVSSIERLSDILGIDHTFMGTTLLALTTSFPELFTSVIAARMGLFDLVFGNIVGSNTFNMMIFVMMDVVWENGSLWDHLSSQHVIAASVVILNMAFFIVACRFQDKRRAFIMTSVLVLILTTICYALLYVS